MSKRMVDINVFEGHELSRVDKYCWYGDKSEYVNLVVCCMPTKEFEVGLDE
jgi:hypothetical protein